MCVFIATAYLLGHASVGATGDFRKKGIVIMVEPNVKGQVNELSPTEAPETASDLHLVIRYADGHLEKHRLIKIK